eukprot:931377_1
MSHWSADDQDEPPINIVSLEICNAFFDWDIEYEYEYADFEATNNDHAIVLQAVQESNIGPDDDLADTLFNTDGSEYQILGESENNAPIPCVIKHKNEGNIPTLTSNAIISTPYVINNINASTAHYNINAEVGGVDSHALVHLFQSAATPLTNNAILPQINVLNFFCLILNLLFLFILILNNFSFCLNS